MYRYQRKEKLNYQVFDNAGRMVIQHSTEFWQGLNSFPVDISKLSAGVYYLNLISDSFNEQLQFVKR